MDREISVHIRPPRVVGGRSTLTQYGIQQVDIHGATKASMSIEETEASIQALGLNFFKAVSESFGNIQCICYARGISPPISSIYFNGCSISELDIASWHAQTVDCPTGAKTAAPRRDSQGFTS